MPSSRCLMFTALLFLAALALLISGDAGAAAAPQINGVWSCDVTRTGNPVTRPLLFVFHSDGTMLYSSQTTVNGGAFSLPFDGRGGGYGEWTKIGPNDYAYRSRENMYINGNAGGFFYVDSHLRLDPKAGELCSGTDDCPGTETKLRLTQFTFGVDGSITGEVDLLPPPARATISCSRLSAEFPDVP